MQAIGDTLKNFEMPQNRFDDVETVNQPQIDEKSETERKEKQLQLILQALPPRFTNIQPNFELFEQIQSTKKSIIFTGPVGTGKTHKMLEIFVPWMLHKTVSNLSWPFSEPKPYKTETVQRNFMTVSEALRKIKQSFDTKTDDDIVEWMTKVEVLFLDDLGTEKISDWTREVFFTVINERYNWMRPIVVSTNLSLREIADSYGDRMASRLYQMAEIIKLQGQDLRLKGKK